MKCTPVGGKGFVDIEREQRLAKGDTLIEELENILSAPGFDRAMKSTNV
jgi:hypothetical protein